MWPSVWKFNRIMILMQLTRKSTKVFKKKEMEVYILGESLSPDELYWKTVHDFRHPDEARKPWNFGK